MGPHTWVSGAQTITKPGVKIVINCYNTQHLQQESELLQIFVRVIFLEKKIIENVTNMLKVLFHNFLNIAFSDEPPDI